MVVRVVDEVCRREGGKVLAGLIRRFGDIGLAEDLLQDAYARALERWPRDGLPDNPAGWLSTVARNRGLDILRRAARTLDDSAEVLARLEALPALEASEPLPEAGLEDDRLRLIFVCCHPALHPRAQSALALRTLCGLSTREIARAFCESEATTAQRLVRAKRKIIEAKIPFVIPTATDLPGRLAIVLQVIYLVFNEGYGATGGSRLVRTDLCREAIRLGRLMQHLMPGDAEVGGLLALMLLTHARSAARVSDLGELLTLEEQDRSRWDRGAIAEGLAVLDAALALRRPGPYQLQAAIAALHARAGRAADTDWPQIAALYRALQRYLPTPVVQMNAAVALGMAEGPRQGLGALKHMAAMETSHYLHAARAEFHRRLGELPEACAAYARAAQLAGNEVERAWLQARRADILSSLPAA
ncbi:RNA polymerase sigma factor [Massilia sp. IC2-476]|uniref:RNA polymerase sigma factor n=1 Tax=Massilia sp. IC2-476 TaxID=2887199 RepID=UPI001D10A2DA|nr:sigma-70 family RNA polymerase sigma factor [Massilia sp. IC2-476]MCC2974115.1 sigma-70 family RNA polymerase sigma factor [Massilia sp. IC2-476]